MTLERMDSILNAFIEKKRVKLKQEISKTKVVEIENVDSNIKETGNRDENSLDGFLGWGSHRDGVTKLCQFSILAAWLKSVAESYRLGMTFYSRLIMYCHWI